MLPVRLLLRNSLDPALELRAVRTPSAILAAADDSLVRPERTDALRKALLRIAYDRTVAGAKTMTAVHARSIGSAEVAARTRHLLTHTSWTVRHPFVQHASLL